MSKKLMVILLAASMVVQLFGCGQQKEASKEQAEPEKGRYVEKDISLPEEIDSKDIIQIGKREDSLCIYVKEQKEDEIKIVSYLYKNGNFEVHTPAWLEDLSFSKDVLCNYIPIKVIENVAGKSYLFCAFMEGEDSIGHLFCSQDGVVAEDVTPGDWLVPVTIYNFYQVPEDVDVLEDGTVVAFYGYNVRTYSPDSYEMIGEVSLQSQYMNLKVYKNEFYLVAMNNNFAFTGIEVYDKECKLVNNISPDEISASNCFFDILSDGSFVLAAKPGLYKTAADNKWEKQVDGIYTTFAMEDKWCIDFTAFDSRIYYALFGTAGENRLLMRYEYDPNYSNLPETVLTVYSIYDNPAINQAAAAFTKKNPGVLVKVEVAISDNNLENPDLKTVLQTVNTKLMNNEGSDIMLLDGMDKDSLIETKVLADMSDIIKPMIEDGTLLPNILNNYVTANGEVYTVPLKFSLNLIVGSKVDAGQADTIKSLAEMAAKHEDSLMGVRTISDLTGQLVPYMVPDIIKGNELNKEALKDNLEYLKTIAINCGIVNDYGEAYRAKNVWELASEISLAFQETRGFVDAIFPMGIMAFVNGTCSAFENAYKPIGEIAINRETENMDVAKEFVKYALSYDIQDTDSYDGFSVNTKALENQITIDRTGWGFETDIAIGDGQYAILKADAISPENLQKLLDFCKKVDKPVVNDQEILKVITEEFPKYLDGTSTIEDTIVRIEKGLNMYLAE